MTKPPQKEVEELKIVPSFDLRQQIKEVQEEAIKNAELRAIASETSQELQKTFATKDALGKYTTFREFYFTLGTVALVIAALYYFATNLMIDSKISQFQKEQAAIIDKTTQAIKAGCQAEKPQKLSTTK